MDVSMLTNTCAASPYAAITFAQNVDPVKVPLALLVGVRHFPNWLPQ